MDRSFGIASKYSSNNKGTGLTTSSEESQTTGPVLNQRNVLGAGLRARGLSLAFSETNVLLQKPTFVGKAGRLESLSGAIWVHRSDHLLQVKSL